ncbi:MAG: site-2 protease family protein [Candidatus Limnocylindrales bacterium]|jgi:Zn-dependent protease
MGHSASVTFKVLSVPITVGPMIVVGLLVVGVLSRLTGAFLVEWVVLGLVALLIHELGHALAFRRYGVKSSISFWVLGGFTVPDDQEAAARLSDRQLLVVTVAGPLVGLVIGVVTLAVGLAAGDAARSIRVPIFLWLFVNLGWALFNLMPVSSLDGGQALEHLAGAVFGRTGRAIGIAAGLLGSGLIAVLAAQLALYSVAFVAVVFGLLNPDPYRQLRYEIWPARPPDPKPNSTTNRDFWTD